MFHIVTIAINLSEGSRAIGPLQLNFVQYWTGPACNHTTGQMKYRTTTKWMKIGWAELIGGWSQNSRNLATWTTPVRHRIRHHQRAESDLSEYELNVPLDTRRVFLGRQSIALATKLRTNKKKKHKKTRKIKPKRKTQPKVYQVPGGEMMATPLTGIWLRDLPRPLSVLRSKW